MILTKIQRQSVTAKLDYGFDWSQWLAADEQIAASEWAGPAGVEITQKLIFDGKIAAARVAVTDAGLVGSKVVLVNHVTSSDGQEDDAVLEIYIRDYAEDAA